MKLYDIIKKPKFMLQGIATYLPESINKYFPQHQNQFQGRGVRRGQGINEIARSCYGNWMRFFVDIHKTDMPVNIDSVAEIGPGDSLGMGMCALLSGAKYYFALDVVKSAYNHDNEEVLEELIKLFRSKSPIPDETELPKNIPRLDSYEFPTLILTDELLKKYLNNERLEKIRGMLKLLTNSDEAKEGELSIKYIVPWTNPELIKKEGVDFLFSAAAMEHIDDLDGAYKATSLWLKGGGYVVHAIDYKSHGAASLWNGHWTYSDLVWKVIRGKSKYFINRAPHSQHIQLMKQNGLRIVVEKRDFRESDITKADLAARFKDMTEDDVKNSDSLVIGYKMAK